MKLKDFGISWLKDMPEHWEHRRVAYLFSERDERSQPDLPLLVVSINTGVTLRKFSDDRIENMAADASSYKVARKGISPSTRCGCGKALSVFRRLMAW